MPFSFRNLGPHILLYGTDFKSKTQEMQALTSQSHREPTHEKSNYLSKEDETHSYQSWKHRMHIECPQVGNTILVPGSMQIPHSWSLSKSSSESLLLSSTLFRDKVSELLLFRLLLSPSSSKLPSSCLSEGYITAASKKISQILQIQRFWHQNIIGSIKKATASSLYYHRIPL